MPMWSILPLLFSPYFPNPATAQISQKVCDHLKREDVLCLKLLSSETKTKPKPPILNVVFSLTKSIAVIPGHVEAWGVSASCVRGTRAYIHYIPQRWQLVTCYSMLQAAGGDKCHRLEQPIQRRH